ncbi:somatostatin-1-like [Hippocampus zosterae]|uniref:somatostatin-1-like n=1 Tax=Hippocampus zosterae TaxID=109293 RepID=UPI00223E8AD8|nr:somatostatin-1-like [Hippocampus zosterae]
MKTCGSWSRCLLALLLAACAPPSAALTRANPGRGAAPASYKQERPGPSPAEALLWDLLQMADEVADEDEWRNGAEERAAAAAPPGSVGPRERKAGCKNFFWKTFTSC